MLHQTLVFTKGEYSSSGVNMLTNSLKILDTTKREFFELIFFQSDEEIWQKYCRTDLTSLSETFNMFTIHKCSDAGLFGHLSNPTSCSV